MFTLAFAAIIWVMPHNSIVAIPMGGDCSYALLDAGYRGIAGDGMEAVYAPQSAIDRVCG